MFSLCSLIPVERTHFPALIADKEALVAAIAQLQQLLSDQSVTVVALNQRIADYENVMFLDDLSLSVVHVYVGHKLKR